MSLGLRPKGCGEPFYRDEAGFSIQMYHNGEIRGNYYVNRSVDWFDYCDKDIISMTEIDAMVKELGHEGFINYWYSIPGDSCDGGLVKLSEDTNSRAVLQSSGFKHNYKLDDDFGTNTGVMIQELDDNYGAIVPVGEGGWWGEYPRVKETGNEAAPDWPTNVELDFEDYECKDYAKYNSDEKLDKNWPEFNAATGRADLKFEIGMLFTDCKVFRAAVREYSIL
ncbi:hypothetical protein L3X38_009997 [Prunus dulcis]|uniref:PB1-like domain-containing protein n=1 Tax=Prunus dulcis TaxID=3755 RepID=A0AAD4WHF5_PRUDU|nr:hypothetical protein L3X38_009997 [Prunus dulcis]